MRTLEPAVVLLLEKAYHMRSAKVHPKLGRLGGTISSAFDVHLRFSFVIPHLALTVVSTWLEVKQVVMRSVDDESRCCGTQQQSIQHFQTGTQQHAVDVGKYSKYFTSIRCHRVGSTPLTCSLKHSCSFPGRANELHTTSC